jgi:hypothetical protein
MLLLSLLGAAFRARPAAGTLALHSRKATPRHRRKYDCTHVLHAHHLVGDAIRLVLKRVIDGAHFEFSLDWAGGALRRSGRWIDRNPGEIPAGAGQLVALEARSRLKHSSVRLRLFLDNGRCCGVPQIARLQERNP